MTRLLLPDRLRTALIMHAERESPNECCGLLAGSRTDDDVVAVEWFPIVNELQSPVAFRSEPRSLFAAMKTMRTGPHDLMAVFHSHPLSAAVPSRRDIEEWTYGDALSVIIGREGDDWSLRAWQWDNSAFREVEIVPNEIA